MNSLSVKDDENQVNLNASNGVSIMTDNDSGYISQHIESNSSADTSVSKQFTLASPNFYVSEDTLLEHPVSKEKKEFDQVSWYENNLSDSVINSSTSTQNESCNLLNLSEVSDISNTSVTIPIAKPIVVSYDKINQLCSEEDIDSNASSVSEHFRDESQDKEDLSLSKCSSQNNDNRSSNSTVQDENVSCVQSRMRDANNCNMSLFESFYSFVCDLYTKDDAAVEDMPALLNPNSLQVANSTSTSSSANSYIELGIVNSKSHSTIDPDDYLNRDELPIGASRGKCSSVRDDKIDTEKIDEELQIVTNKSSKDCKLLKTNNASQVIKETNCTQTKVANETPHAIMKPTNAEMSPELFSDDETAVTITKRVSKNSKELQDNYVTTTDKKLFKHAQENLTGVPPPPSVTILQITIDEMLKKIEDNKHLFITTSDLRNAEETSINARPDGSGKVPAKAQKSLVIQCKRSDFNAEAWPEILQYRYHGLHFNRSKLSEDFENLCTKYAERCVGAETQSSCTVFGFNSLQSPSKHKCRIRRTLKSPGKRLSHLARRRITFSKDSLNSSIGSASCSFIGARTRQIMVDVRKCQSLAKRRSPKKKTPCKSPRKTPNKSPRKKLKTPSSSSKKRFSMRLRMFGNENSSDSIASTSSNSKVSVTKRALFQSPNKELSMSLSRDSSNDCSNHSARRRTPRRALFPSPVKNSPSKMTISCLYPSKRKLTPKRALFTSPEKSVRSSEANDKKRKRTDSESGQPSKLSRSSSSDMNYSIEKSLQNSMRMRNSAAAPTPQSSQEVADIRKKKLMWSVAEALRSQNIDLKHPQFKIYASVLARIIRHFLPTLFTNGPRHEGSTTETMLRIARKYVFAVTRGKTVDAIIREAKNEKLKHKSEYSGLERNETLQTRNRDGILQDRVNIITSDRTGTENNKSGRRENVERIRKIINFGDDEVNNVR